MHSRLRSWLTSLSLAAVAIASIVVAPASVAGAANPPAFTITTDTHRATNGTVLNLTTTQPILSAGSTTNTMIRVGALCAGPDLTAGCHPVTAVANFPHGWDASHPTSGIRSALARATLFCPR